MIQSAESDIEMLVTVADDHLSDFQQIVHQLRGTGLKISHTMESLGIVSGTINAADLEKIKSLQGIAAIEPAGSVQLPPPDSEIQ